LSVADREEPRAPVRYGTRVARPVRMTAASPVVTVPAQVIGKARPGRHKPRWQALERGRDSTQACRRICRTRRSRPNLGWWSNSCGWRRVGCRVVRCPVAASWAIPLGT
jgi:hypothetical protein